MDVTDEPDNTEAIADEESSGPAADVATDGVPAPWLVPYRSGSARHARQPSLSAAAACTGRWSPGVSNRPSRQPGVMTLRSSTRDATGRMAECTCGRRHSPPH